MTDIEIYDRAIYEYLMSISDKIIYSTTSRAFKNMTKQMKYEDYVPYNMISFYRDPNFAIDTDRYHFTGAVFGDFTRLTADSEGNREARYVHNLPVNLTYQIDIWAPKEVIVQETAIKLISKIHMENQVVIAPMNPDGEEARFHITNVEWVDNSDLEEEDDRGKIYRHTVSITIDSRIKLTRDVSTQRFRCVPIDIYEDERK